MFIYDMGIVDFYGTLRHLPEFFKEVPAVQTVENLDCEVSQEELRNFILKAFVELKSSGNIWEGDIRHKEIFIGSIPGQEFNCSDLFVIFKQDNNGSTFLVSQCEMPYDNSTLIFPNFEECERGEKYEEWKKESEELLNRILG